MAVSADLLARAKAALRISSTNKQITGEIEDCIEACKADLALAGVCVIIEDDPLIIRAVILYCESFFGYMEKAEQYKQSYDLLKMSLALSGDYNEQRKPQDIGVGNVVIVNGTIFTIKGSAEKCITKSNAKMYVVEMLDKAQYRYYIGLALAAGGEVQGYAIPEICRAIE